MKRKFSALLAILFILYGIMAMEHSVKLMFPHSPELWQSFFEGVTGSAYSSGVGSVYVEQSLLYVKHRGSMLFHTVFGGTALIVGLFQFWPWMRAHRLIHRRLGYVYLIAAGVSMLGSSIFLLAIDSTQAFSGTVFYWGLSGLCVATWEALLMVCWTVKKRSFDLHREYTMLSFAFLSTAPILRMAWIAGAPLTTQNQVNLCASMFLIPLSILPCNLLIKNFTLPLLSQTHERRKLKAIALVTLAFLAFYLCFQTLKAYPALIVTLLGTNFLLVVALIARRRSMLRSALCAHPLLLILSLGLFAKYTSTALTTQEAAIVASWAIPVLTFTLFSVVQCLNPLKECHMSGKWIIFLLVSSLSPLLSALAYPLLLDHYQPTQSLLISLMMSYALSIYIGHRLVMEFNFGFLKSFLTKIECKVDSTSLSDAR